MARPRKDIIRIHLSILESQNQTLKHLAKLHRTSVSQILQTLIFNFIEKTPALNPAQTQNQNQNQNTKISESPNSLNL